MNYLAHLYFADPTPESMMANLMGDYIKGPLAPDWQPALRDGVVLHRKIDAFTDTHPLFLQASRRLSPARRRFAGVILDICFDHYLCQHWQRFCEQSLAQFISGSYQLLDQYEGYMPESMRLPVSKMIEQDWLGSYAAARQIPMVLDRVARRLRRPDRMLGAGEEFLVLYPELEQDFLGFFPQLINHVERLKAVDRQG
ncbi:ACP phosphodiesterase [Motiliproteus sp.]|uniref:acyl carrier protein phosphodiesterase n=1 Tax=Motiliproteus sp. TaxID=1898955 RepID=UPI003BA8A6A6